VALSTVTKNSNDGVLVGSDGTGTPVTLTIPVTVGDTTIDDFRSASVITGEANEISAYTVRGKRDSERANGTRITPSGSFTVHFREFTNAAAGNVLDFIRFAGAYEANISTTGANRDVKMIDLILTVEGTTHGDGADAVVTLSDCYCTAAFAEGDPSTLTISYTCYGGMVLTGG